MGPFELATDIFLVQTEEGSKAGLTRFDHTIAVQTQLELAPPCQRLG